jgi:hypothetical protein
VRPCAQRDEGRSGAAGGSEPLRQHGEPEAHQDRGQHHRLLPEAVLHRPVERVVQAQVREGREHADVERQRDREQRRQAAAGAAPARAEQRRRDQERGEAERAGGQLSREAGDARQRAAAAAHVGGRELEGPVLAPQHVREEARHGRRIAPRDRRPARRRPGQVEVRRGAREHEGGQDRRHARRQERAVPHQQVDGERSGHEHDRVVVGGGQPREERERTEAPETRGRLGRALDLDHAERERRHEQVVQREDLGGHRVGPDERRERERPGREHSGPRLAGGPAHRSAHEARRQRAAHRREQVHAQGDLAERQPGERVREQRVERIARRMRDAQRGGDGDQLAAVAAHHRRRERAQVDGQRGQARQRLGPAPPGRGCLLREGRRRRGCGLGRARLLPLRQAADRSHGRPACQRLRVRSRTL